MSDNAVYKAIAKVTAAMASEGIGKGRKNAQQGYSFRGIDDVYNTLSRMLADAGLCIIPRALSRTCEERAAKSGGALFTVVVDMEYDLVSAEDGSKHTAKVYGEAMDSADKATNKAMSAAYKYMAFQAFAIPTEGDNDADSHTHAAVPKPVKVTEDVWATMTEAQQNKLTDIAMVVVEHFTDGDVAEAARVIDDAGLDAEEKIALWSKFDSKQRSALKRHKQEAALVG